MLHGPFLQPVAHGPLPQLTESTGLVLELQNLSSTVALLLFRSTHITLRVIMPKWHSREHYITMMIHNVTVNKSQDTCVQNVHNHCIHSLTIAIFNNLKFYWVLTWLLAIPYEIYSLNASDWVCSNRNAYIHSHTWVNLLLNGYWKQVDILISKNQTLQI